MERLFRCSVLWEAYLYVLQVANVDILFYGKSTQIFYWKPTQISCSVFYGKAIQMFCSLGSLPISLCADSQSTRPVLWDVYTDVQWDVYPDIPTFHGKPTQMSCSIECLPRCSIGKLTQMSCSIDVFYRKSTQMFCSTGSLPRYFVENIARCAVLWEGYPHIMFFDKPTQMSLNLWKACACVLCCYK